MNRTEKERLSQAGSMKMFRSIQWRITFSFTLLVIIGMTALGFYLTGNIRSSQLENLRYSLKNQAEIVTEAVLPVITEPDGTENIIAFTSKLGEIIEARITVIAPDGTVLADSKEDIRIMENHASRPEFRDAVSDGFGESTRYSTTLNSNMMYVAVPVYNHGEISGVVRVALPLTDVEELLGRVRASIVIALIITVFMVVLAAWLITRLLTRPLREVTEASRRIASGELTQKINAGTTDETAELARSFNQMSLRLTEMMETITEDRARLAGILDNIVDGVIMTDTEGKVVLANKAIEKIFHIKNEDLISMPLIEILRDHEISELMELCLDSNREQVAQFESELFKRFLRAIAVPLKGRKIKGTLILFQDLTEVRNLQTMRRELIGNISHEFRTPLAGIKAMVETLQDGAIDEKDTAIDFLLRIDSEVDRLTQMVSELTELSKIETGEAELKLELLDIRRLANEVVSQLSPQAERKQLSILKNFAEDLPAIRADRERIRQVIINLLHNAIKFTEPGGSITIRVTTDRDALTIDITDTGIGIASDDLPHIFERFYKADRARTGGGTGIGLAIARHVIEAHGGSIHALSQPGKGSTFSFSLPVKNSSE